MTKYESLVKRRDDLREWLKEHGQNCHESQKHLDEGSAERVYWHYGYMMAMTDAINLIDSDEKLPEKLTVN